MIDILVLKRYNMKMIFNLSEMGVKMRKYNTNQKREILQLLSNENKLLSVKEIYELLSKSCNIGLTTIYRYLNYLEKENKIKKYIENNEAKYLLIVNSDLEKIYIKCQECGKLAYFDCDEIKEVKEHLKDHHNIVWDFTKSNIVGKCVDCNKNKLEKKLKEKL